MKPIRTTVLGLGRIAWMLEQDKLRYHPCTHAGSLRKLQKYYKLVGAADLALDRVSDFQKWWHPGADATPRRTATAPVLGTNSRLVLNQSQAELVIIAASLSSHEELFKQALKASPHAIVLEKPPAESLKATRKILKQAGNTPVWVNYERRYHPNYILTKRLIDSGTLGDLRSIHGQVLVGHSPGAGESGPLLHDASHWLDLLLWFVGEPQTVTSRLLRDRGRSEHTTFATFHYPNFDVTLESGGRRRYFEFEMQIDFSEGRILCGNNGLRVFESRPSRKYQGFRELRQKNVKPTWNNPWLALYKDVYNVMRHSGAKPISSLANACAGMKWIDQILQNSRG